MKILFPIFALLGFSNLLAQAPVFKNSISGELGLRVYDTDLGLGTGFDAGITFNVYNVAPEHSPIVLSIRPYFNNFNAEDKAGTKANREFLGFSGGVGLHFDEKVFAVINVGHLFLLNSNTDRAALENTGVTYTSVKGSYIFKPMEDSNFSFYINGEVGYTFSDVESLDRGPADKFEGSTFVSLCGGIIHLF